MLLFFVRHGDPTYDPDELTPLGKRQAEAIAKRLALYGLDEIYVSSSNRAIETAQPTCEILKKKAAVLDWTNEGHAWNEQSMELPDGGRVWGFATQKVKDSFTSKSIRELGELWYEHPDYVGTDFAKGHLRIRKQTLDFLEELGYCWDSEKGQYRNLHKGKNRVALFAHHGFGTNFLSAVLNIPFPQVCLKMDIGHTGLTVIEFEEGDYVIPKMLTLANDGHLLAERMPTCYNNRIYF